MKYAITASLVALASVASAQLDKVPQCAVGSPYPTDSVIFQLTISSCNASSQFSRVTAAPSLPTSSATAERVLN